MSKNKVLKKIFLNKSKVLLEHSLAQPVLATTGNNESSKRLLCPERIDEKEKPTRNQTDAVTKHFMISTLIVCYRLSNFTDEEKKDTNLG